MKRDLTLAWSISGSFHIAMLAMLAVRGVRFEATELSIRQGGVTIVAMRNAPPEATDREDQPVHVTVIQQRTVEPESPRLEPLRSAVARRSVAADVEMRPVDIGDRLVVPPSSALARGKSAVPDQPPPTVLPPLAHLARRATSAELPTKVEPLDAPSVASASAATAGAEVDQLPRKLPDNPAPHYPSDAYARRQQGRVLLEVQIDAGGSVTAIRVWKSSGVSSLDRAALDTVQDWRFLPARRGGATVAFTALVPIRFAIRTAQRMATWQSG